MPTQRLKIKGMTCAGCVRRVENALLRTLGVRQATVNLATETAEVELDQPVAPDTLIEAVRKVGFDGALLAPEAGAPDDAAQGLQRRLLFSVVFTVPIVVLSMFLPQPLPYQGWLLLALTLPVQFGAALPLYKAAYG
ncbi:MAG: cation transporter, partial [Fimbriimonadales bacterium]